MMMIIGTAINLICAYRILLLIRNKPTVTTTTQRLLRSLFIVCAGIGSTNVFLTGRSFTYHEAIMWGGAFSLLFAWTILKYLAQPGHWRLALAGFFAFMAFHCRPTAGAGALLAMSIICAILTCRALTRSQAAQSLLALSTVARPGRHALVAAVAIAITLATYFSVNYAKFQTFDGVPLRYYAWYNAIPIRMKITGGKQLHLENIPPTWRLLWHSRRIVQSRLPLGFSCARCINCRLALDRRSREFLHLPGKHAGPYPAGGIGLRAPPPRIWRPDSPGTASSPRTFSRRRNHSRNRRHYRTLSARFVSGFDRGRSRRCEPDRV
jgi:hypothetical protein